jgi:hypothetical protein
MVPASRATGQGKLESDGSRRRCVSLQGTRTRHPRPVTLVAPLFRPFHRLVSGHAFPTQMEPRPSPEPIPPNKAPEPTTTAVTIRAPSSTARASRDRGSSLTFGKLMKTLLIALLLCGSQFVPCFAADATVIGDTSPVPVISASRALREFSSDAQTNARDELKSALALVSLTEDLIVARWRKVHRKDVKSRDAVLAEVDQLTKRIDQLLVRVSAAQPPLPRERLRELKAALDVAVDDFRLRLRTTFFH